MEAEKLTNIGFLMDGQASYVFPSHKDAEYFQIEIGEQFGLADIVFKVTFEQFKYNKQKE